MLFGLALAIFSFWSAAARLRITARAPPGGGGESGRAVDWPEAGGELTGDAGRGEDCFARKASIVSYRMSGLNCSEQEGGDRAVMATSIIGDASDCAGASAQWAAYGLGKSVPF